MDKRRFIQIGSILLCVIASSLIIIACTNENTFFPASEDITLEMAESTIYNPTNDTNDSITIRRISKKDIPEGIEPLMFKNEQELNEFVEKFKNDKITLEPMFSSDIAKPTLLKQRIEGGGAGIIERDFVVHSNSITGDDILRITLSYTERGGSITVSSRPANRWICADWVQDAGVASWVANKYIKYYVSGYIRLFAGIPGIDYELERKNVRKEGVVHA